MTDTDDTRPPFDIMSDMGTDLRNVADLAMVLMMAGEQIHEPYAGAVISTARMIRKIAETTRRECEQARRALLPTTAETEVLP